MIQRRNRIVAGVLLVAAGLTAGCDSDFIRREAQRAFAGFLNGIVTTAINQAVGPQD